MEKLPSCLLPQGFFAAGVHCGVKNDSALLDLSLFVSDCPAVAAGVFTQNLVCGAPVKVSRERVPSDSVRAVVINSGNANACTAERGLADARRMTAAVAESIHHLKIGSGAEIGSGEPCSADDVLVCSTGVIGRFLPIDAIVAGIPEAVSELVASPSGFQNAARGMMTTDTFAKQAVREISVSSGLPVRISGAAKGAAMIAPNMATMLAVVMTDAALSTEQADGMLRHAVDRSFNCISVEGHTSTSDSVVLLANGRAGNGSLNDADLEVFQRALDELCADLAMQIIRDAEGADHFITIDVRGFSSRDDAHCVAKKIAEDPLVKTAITGADPNWGRIISATGGSGVVVKEEEISLTVNGILLFERGRPTDFDEQELSAQIRENRDVHIAVEVMNGDVMNRESVNSSEAVRFWTCDLTQEYVRLNSEYTT